MGFLTTEDQETASDTARDRRIEMVRETGEKITLGKNISTVCDQET